MIRAGAKWHWVALFAVVLLASSAGPVIADPSPDPPEVTGVEPSLPDAGQVSEGIAHAAKEARDREEALDTPAAYQEREESLDAFASSDSPAEAAALLTESFSGQLATLNDDPARFLSDATLVQPLGATAATVESEGDGQLMDGGMPVRIEDEDGALKKVDLSLEPAGDGFATANALVDLRIGASASDGVDIAGGLSISQVGTSADSAASRLGDKNVLFADVGVGGDLADTDLLVAPIASGVELFSQLRSAESPETLRFRIGMPEGANLRSDGQGGAEVVRNEGAIAYVPPPFAVDAQGRDVSVAMGVEGDVLNLQVAHRELDVAYPLLVDPAIYEDWINPGTSWVNGHNLGALSNGSWTYTESHPWVESGTSCIYTCWSGSGRGLFVSMPNGVHWEQQYGHWAYSAPNTASYLANAWANPFVRNDHGCPRSQYPRPHDYVGMWYQNKWNRVVNNQAAEVGSVDIQSWGSAFILGLSTGNGNGAFSMPCWRDLYVGGAVVWLDDWQYPSLQAVTGYPSGWIGGSTQFTLSTSATDAGLGIQNVTVYPQGTVEKNYVLPQNQCYGGKSTPCPTTQPVTFPLTGASFLEGERSASLNAHDPTGKYSSNAAWTMRVDKTSPDITLAGQLARATDEDFAAASVQEEEEKDPEKWDELSLPVYNLKIETKDGSLDSNAAKRSGVKDIEVFLDGSEVSVPWASQACPGSSCPMTQTYQLKLTQLATAGTHTLEVKAVDQVGNVRERKVEFEYIPATGIEDQYVMHYFPLPDGEGNEAEEEHPDRPELAVNVMNGNLVYREEDIDIDGTAVVDLEVERYYNSQLPNAENTEWGDGWTLAETPELDPVKTGGSPVPNEANVLSASGKIKAKVELPTVAGATKFDPVLQATFEKKASGGYEMTDETGESPTSISFDETGQTEALLTDGHAKVDYSYESGELAEIEVVDPGTFAADPAELEIPEPELVTKPTYSRSFGTNGSGDGQLKSPGDVAVDAQGNLWVVDKANNRVQKFDSTGKFLTKFGALGTGNGQFNRPTAIAIAANGDLLVTDAGNSRVQRFNSSGSYLSQFGSKGSGNGQFASGGPEGIAIDGSGNIWVTDTYAGRVQKFNSAGSFLLAAGTKGSGSGQLGEPTGIDLDPNGYVWVADWQNNRISAFTSAGTFTGQFGSYGTGNGQFNHPDEIEIDTSGNVWIGDQGNNRVQRFNLVGQYQDQFGSYGSGAGQFSFGFPMGIAADSKGHLWIADVNNHRVQEWLLPLESPTYISSFGSSGTGDGQLKAPADIALGVEGNLWVVDKSNNRLQKFDPAGKFLAKFGTTGSGDGQFNRPTAIAIDRDGNLLVADAGNNRVQRFDPAGQFISKFGSLGTGNGQLKSAEGIATDFEGNIWVADTINGRLQKFDENGEFVKVVGSKGSGSGQLGEPTGIDIDSAGNVWVADRQNNRISVFTEAGDFLSQFGSTGSGPGQFGHPEEVNIDWKGNVWIGDAWNSRVQRFDLAAQFKGQFGSFGQGQGQFYFTPPMGIATDRLGHIWTTDGNNHRVQRWRLGNYAQPAAQEIDLSDGDAKVEVETPGGLVASVAGNAAGEHAYTHSGDDLTAHDGPGGETKYEYDVGGRMTKVTLPNGTLGQVAYWPDGRVKSVTVAPEGANPETTQFEYTDEPRRTFVEVPGAPNITYDIGEDGSVLKWWHQQQPPQFLDISGSLWAEKEAEIATGDHTLSVIADSPEGISSIQFIANADRLVDEKTCAQDPEKPGTECTKLENLWVTNTANFSPGLLEVEVIVTDSDENAESERFWVEVPYTPPPPAGAAAPPSFQGVLRFREDYGLEVVFPVASENELAERIFDLLHAWHSPHTPAGEVARASWERWGVPLRPADVAELEYREQFYSANAARIDQWMEEVQSDSFGGYYLDQAGGGIMRIGFLGNQIDQLNNLKISLSLEGGERLQVYPTAPTATYLSVQAMSSSVLNAMKTNPTLASLIVGVEVDESGRTVHVGTPHVSQVQGILAQMLGPSAPVTVEYKTANGQFLSGRFRTEGRMRAGDAIFFRHYNAENKHDGNLMCTAGYGAKDKAGEVGGKAIWRLFVLTAGHCSPQIGDQAYRSTDSSPLNESNWSKVGEVTRSGFHQVGPIDTDALAVRVHSAGVVPQVIFGPGGNPLPTEPAGTVKIRNTVCFSGARTQRESCGQVVGRALDWAGAGDGVPRSGYWVKFNEPRPQVGDSGAPVYSIFGSSIGLISADRNNGEETYVAPLLTPPGMDSGKVPGILGDPHLRPLSLKLGE